MKNNWIILILALFMPVMASGQIVTVKASFEQDSLMLGKQTTFTISARAGLDVNVEFPEYSDTITSQLEILESFPMDTLENDARRTILKRYRVTSFEPGWNTIPPQPVAFRKGTLSDTVYTTAQLITVLAPAVDTTQAIRPIKPPIYTPVSFAEMIPWILIGLGGLLVIAIIWILVRRYLKGRGEYEEEVGEIPLEPAHTIAFRELDSLREERLPQKGRVKEYYSRLTEIIRVYMARQFEIHAMESTSQEILEAFSVQNAGHPELNQKLQDLLMLADLVKFAKEDPTPNENELHLNGARDFVEKTYRMFMQEEEESIGMNNVEIPETVKTEEQNG